MIGGDHADATDVFEGERPRLFGIAYRMLGSVSDADDVVQDAWLRWCSTDRASIRTPAAFLTTVTSRIALDRLGSAQRRRETYVGPWLPEPLASADDDPESTTIMAESVMLGFLAVLERLGPVERAVFVLREVFALPYDEVAAVVDRSEDACRQIARRARSHVRTERPRVSVDRDRDRKLLDAFLGALASGVPEELAALLHDDVVLVSDGGPDVRAARHPIVGRDRVTRFVRGISRNPDGNEVDLRFVTVNGQVALLVRADGHDTTLFTVEPDASGTRVQRVFALRNPDKLALLELGDDMGGISEDRMHHRRDLRDE